MSNPLVSVVIPTYNTGEYIVDAIDSVLKQQYRPFEVIVVDDGSTDRTAEIVKQYVRDVQSIQDVQDVRNNRTSRTSLAGDGIDLVYIYQKNGGRASARNTGIKAAQGKYVAFLDSDDLWTQGKLGKQVHIMEMNDQIDFLFGDKQRFSDGGKIAIHSMFHKNNYDEKFFGDPLYVRDAYQKLLQVNFIPTGTVILKRECLDRTGLFDQSIYAEDYEFWLRVALFGTIAYANELWELERDREGSGSKNLKAVYLSNIRTLEKHEKEYQERLSGLRIDLNSALRDNYRDTGYYFLSHERMLARECFINSLRRGFQLKTMIYWMATFLGLSFVKTIQRARE
jgi:glycosyltransferase involved in cell wall biosynthesis